MVSFIMSTLIIIIIVTLILLVVSVGNIFDFACVLGLANILHVQNWPLNFDLNMCWPIGTWFKGIGCAKMVLMSAARACLHMGAHARFGTLKIPAPSR